MARYWFRPRRYGYGATPTTWEGWALTAAVGTIVAVSVLVMNLLADRSNFAVWIAWAAVIAGVIIWFVRISCQRTDGEWRWRWNAPRPDGSSHSST
jgi:peptidoglycan biosynthesis protein MviN/MurJ (putative lipid II flippase)